LKALAWLILLKIGKTELERNSLIVPIHSLGLSNRLRVLASSHQLAVETKKKLFIDWRPSPSCAAEFEDLFELQSPPDALGFELFNRNDSNLLYELAQGVTRRQPRREAIHLPSGGLKVAAVRHRGALFDLREVEGADVVVLIVSGFFQISHIPCKEYYLRKRSFYRSLQLVPPVAQELRSLLAVVMGGPGGPVVGVHVRAFDGAHDWATVPPPPSAPPGAPALTFEEAAPPAAFARVMDQILERFPRAKFYLASNSNDVKKAFLDRYSSDVVYTINVDNDLAKDRASAAGLRLALLDWWALGHAALVVHSFGSSFAEEAAGLHGPPTVRVRQGGNFMGPDLDMPFCNNHVLGNAIAEQYWRLQRMDEMQNEEELDSLWDNLEELPFGALIPVNNQYSSSPIAKLSPSEEDFVRRYGELDCFTDPAQGEICTRPVNVTPCVRMRETWGLVDNIYC